MGDPYSGGVSRTVNTGSNGLSRVHSGPSPTLPAGLSLPEAFHWLLEAGHKDLLGVSEQLLMVDREPAKVLALFGHRELWAWAHDQTQAVMGWQPLPFLDGRPVRLLWTQWTTLGAISGAIFALGAPDVEQATPAQEPAERPGDIFADVVPGTSPAATAIRGQLASWVGRCLCVRVTGPRGVGKDYVARALLSTQERLAPGRLMDPLVVDDPKLIIGEIWSTRVRDAIERGRPLFIRDLHSVPDRDVHVVFEWVTRAVASATPLVVSHAPWASDFSARRWEQVLPEQIRIPELVSRPEDLPELVRALGHATFGQRCDLKLTAGALRLLSGVRWVGNTAELEAVVIDARRRSGTDRLSENWIRLPSGATGGAGLADLERRAVQDALERTGGNRTAAAALLGISRSTLHRRLKAQGV
ncbi:hypothetical protein EDL96_10475 [Kocuria soli]|uniref:Sigma-54 factor interaction domain-containing protein n=1 Tax=Kocuria soli TaxID=2485125 RepID=A0A3N3ZND0_9MICC|nr:hypothetical protein EDL96_10475 [Kocuria soli]